MMLNGEVEKQSCPVIIKWHSDHLLRALVGDLCPRRPNPLEGDQNVIFKAQGMIPKLSAKEFGWVYLPLSPLEGDQSVIF